MSDAMQLDLLTRVMKRVRQRAVSEHATEIALLVPIAETLSKAAGLRGIIVDEVRVAAEQTAPPMIARSVPGKQRALSWLREVPIAAGLYATDERRLSRSRNDQLVYLHPEFVAEYERLRKARAGAA